MKAFEDIVNRMTLLAGPLILNYIEFDGQYVWTAFFVAFGLFTLYHVGTEAVRLLLIVHRRLFPEHYQD